jgi:hypothetical protein
MFSGPPLPLPEDLPLSLLLAHVSPSGTLGAWTRGCRYAVHVYDTRASRCRVLISADLGFLLGRCSQVALREGEELVVLEAERVIEWRTLQIVTGTPFLPGLERLNAMFPRAYLDSSGFRVPISSRSAEEVFAECLMHGIPVSGSRIVYCLPPPPPRPWGPIASHAPIAAGSAALQGSKAPRSLSSALNAGSHVQEVSLSSYQSRGQ